VVKYHVVVEERTFEIDIDAEGRVWVDRQPVEVDLEGIDGLPRYSLLVGHRSYDAHIEMTEDGACQVVVRGRPYRARIEGGQQKPRRTRRARRCAGPAEVLAPLPGLVVELRVTEGQAVQEGQVVAVLESMKMKIELRAPRDGVARGVQDVAGRQVAQGQLLATIC
jgi:biotin carboxyl carrier protein